MKNKELDDTEYSQSSKNRNASILGFVWAQADEIIIVTDQGVELFQVIPERRCLKALKNVTANVNWFVSCPLTHLLMLAGGPASANMQPVSYLQAGIVSKLPKFQSKL